MISSKDRKNLENDIYDLLNDLDPSGRNTIRLKKLYDSMDDKTFSKHMKDFFDDEDKFIRLSLIPLEYPLTFSDICKIGEKHGVPIFEHVVYPNHADDPNNPPVSVHEIIVLEIPVKRLQQMLFKKNATSTSITHRNPKTNQVIDKDKNARFTDVEAYSLIVQNQYDVAREFYGPRADDIKMEMQMLKDIQKNGEVSLDKLDNDMLNKTTPNTINYMLLGACIQSNIISNNGLILPNTLNSREEKQVTIDRN